MIHYVIDEVDMGEPILSEGKIDCRFRGESEAELEDEKNA